MYLFSCTQTWELTQSYPLLIVLIISELLKHEEIFNMISENEMKYFLRSLNLCKSSVVIIEQHTTNNNSRINTSANDIDIILYRILASDVINRHENKYE
ncbi:CLUMA_CG015913, isoform A [Clunio marinus]|uniref:CLUMA_CG015913, isoform A n=1 Tax=Clunio marinus TaxID=568069 RepID=A0A1J1IRL6_9DIPT|nr:CLUMA_CG015913, isoform A [Clunio marinus]